MPVRVVRQESTDVPTLPEKQSGRAGTARLPGDLIRLVGKIHAGPSCARSGNVSLDHWHNSRYSGR